MNSFALLEQLIGKLEAYENAAEDKNNLSMEGFYQSISGEVNLTALKNSFIGEVPETDAADRKHFIETNIERVISQNFLFLYRYIKYYSKIALKESVINSIEEFGMAMTVLQYQSISKTDLIKKNVIEKSSGVEIINRLIKIGLLTQTDNPDDHRSQLIGLSDQGKFELFKTFENMNTLGLIATGTLNTSEKVQLAMILKKLDQFHFNNYNNKSLNNLEDFLP
ncbi:MarR family transcriptional regulator [Gynurincola endophyticus]|uniref:MarR family transcriptional regulator n=1 Tax=Gynurincola endophyticus TaxID=2479004 RepID=UPI000F8CB2AF|nr:MarR family transcriptional regulator [Gynurincola endophyticus]